MMKPRSARRPNRVPEYATHNLIEVLAGCFKPRNALKSTLALFVASLQVFPAFAWVFPEHRDITVLAVQRMDSERQTQLQALWSEARRGHEARLCAPIADPAPAPSPARIDFPAMAATS